MDGWMVLTGRANFLPPPPSFLTSPRIVVVLFPVSLYRSGAPSTHILHAHKFPAHVLKRGCAERPTTVRPACAADVMPSANPSASIQAAAAHFGGDGHSSEGGGGNVLNDEEDGNGTATTIGRRRAGYCCCLNLHVKMATILVASVSLFFIISNFVAKICGYSEIGWNFELLFLIIDGAAVLSMFYGLGTENAAFLQPFVMLSLITISLLVSLAAYLGTAMRDSNSYAGQELELELNKRLSDAAKRLNLEFKFMVSVVASIAFFTVLLSIFIHFWFAYVTVQCAKFFRGQQCPENKR